LKRSLPTAESFRSFLMMRGKDIGNIPVYGANEHDVPGVPFFADILNQSVGDKEERNT